MKVLVVLNENPAGSHPDVYEAFTGLVSEGLVRSYDVYSHLLARARGLTGAQIARELLESVGDAGHDLIIWMHTSGLEVGNETLRAMSNLSQHPIMAYWEADSYHPLFKPIPKPMVRIMRYCSRVFVPCGGPLLAGMARAGINEVRYAPSTASKTRFLPLWSPDGRGDHGIILIGNKVTSRIPFKTMPGARARRRLVKAFEQRCGAGFAVYGSGWRGPSAKGPREFDEQQRLNAGSRLAVGIENLFSPWYFSNRLPIALACGVPLIYRRNPGFDQVFGESLADRFFDTTPQAIAMAERLLASDDDTLRAQSRANRLFFEENLTTELVARYVVSTSLSHAGKVPTDSKIGGAGANAEPLWQRIPPLVSGGRVHG